MQSNVRSRFVPKPRDDLTACKNCGRNFAEDRIEKHQEICMKTSKKKRKTFDMTKKRVQGTEAETFVLKPKKGGRVSIFSSTFLCYTFNKKSLAISPTSIRVLFCLVSDSLGPRLGLVKAPPSQFYGHFFFLTIFW